MMDSQCLKTKKRGSRSCFFGIIEKRIDKNIKGTCIFHQIFMILLSIYDYAWKVPWLFLHYLCR